MPVHAYPTVPLVGQRWRRHAACCEMSVNRFFQSGQPSADIVECCLSCPVHRECRDWALSDPQQRGYLGGTTEQDRDQIRQAREEQSASAVLAPSAFIKRFGRTAVTRARVRRIKPDAESD